MLNKNRKARLHMRFIVRFQIACVIKRTFVEIIIIKTEGELISDIVMSDEGEVCPVDLAWIPLTISSLQ